MAKVLMLGAGECQLNLINELKEKNHDVIICDYYKDSPGKRINEKNYLVSTFDLDKNLEVAKKENIDCLVTAGTDQPVKTVSYVSERMGIKSFLTYNQSLNLTNKKRMKLLFRENDIPYVNYQLIKKDIKEAEITINFPAVLKPLDSQGQRGIYRVDDFKEVKKYIDDSFFYTREDEILLEEYYPNDEITVSGWVEVGKTYILSISDRETFSEDVNIGICKGHRYPSIHFKKHKDEIVELTEKIVKAFEINNGPIYFQMFIGKEGIKVNEVAARLGGAYEDEYIPIATGVSLLELLIDRSLNNYNHSYLTDKDYLDITKYIYVLLIFSKSGVVKKVTPFENISVIRSGKLFIKEGDSVETMTNATNRIGYGIIIGNSENELNDKIKKFWEEFNIILED